MYSLFYSRSDQLRSSAKQGFFSKSPESFESGPVVTYVYIMLEIQKSQHKHACKEEEHRRQQTARESRAQKVHGRWSTKTEVKNARSRHHALRLPRANFKPSFKVNVTLGDPEKASGNLSTHLRLHRSQAQALLAKISHIKLRLEALPLAFGG